MKAIGIVSLLSLALIAVSCKDKQETTLEKEFISLDGVTSGRPYSPAVLVGNTLYLSGQIAISPETGKIVEGGIEEQTDQVLRNMEALIEKAGFTMGDVVKCNVLLSDISYYGQMNAIYSGYFSVNPPARKAFAVMDLPLGALVEIDAIAIK